jgi:hypothetical protein
MAPCSADARRAPGAVGVSRPWKTSAIAPALAFHGGLTPAALVNMRWSIAKIAFRWQTFAPQHRSGGRPPPVDSENALATTIPQYADDCRRRTEEPHCNRSNQNHGGLVAVCDSPRTCVVEPRRADGRRSRSRVRRRCATVGRIVLALSLPRTTAGSRPPLLARVRWFPNMTGLLLHTVGKTWHGGLTPAALGHVRLCTADGALFSGRSSCTRSGRRKPTVENVRDCTGVSNPRRAHARRSWPRALVHRKNRFSPADIRTANQERGASAPRGSATVPAREIPHTFTHDRRTATQ